MSNHTLRNTQSSPQLQLVSFTVGEELFAVDILSVQEINRMIALTKVPQSPEGIEGVINLRGRIIPVLDLRIQFGIGTAELNDESRIVVVEVQGTTVGFIVDSVHEVLRIERSIVEPTPQMTSSIDSSYVAGVAKLPETLLILLDLDNLLSIDSIEKISGMSRKAA
jgi:purine-binding chemotaxis protein CheW